MKVCYAGLVRHEIVVLMFAGVTVGCQQILGVKEGAPGAGGGVGASAQPAGGGVGGDVAVGGNSSGGVGGAAGGAGGLGGVGGSAGMMNIGGYFVFVTTAEYEIGSSPDIQFDSTPKADALCNAEASGVLAGTYVAWLSKQGAPAMAMISPATGPWYLPGVPSVIFVDAQSIAAVGPSQPINRDAAGAPADGVVFTGTDASGAGTGQDCDDWKGGTYETTLGSTTLTTAGWTNFSSNSCNNLLARLYCFQVDL